jgi:hypothetical protein
MNTNNRRVSFSEEPKIEILDKNDINVKEFSYRSVESINTNVATKFPTFNVQSQEKTRLDEYSITIKLDDIQIKPCDDVDTYIEILTDYFYSLDSEVSEDYIRNQEIFNILQKALKMLFKNKLFNKEEMCGDITLKEFLFIYIEPMVCYNSYKHSLHSERLKDKCKKNISKIEKKVLKNNFLCNKDIKFFFKNTIRCLQQLDIDQVKNKFIKYIIAVMFKKVIKNGNSKSTLLNIIAVHIKNINTYFTATDKLNIMQPILDKLIYWLINYYTNSNYNSNYIIARRDGLSNIIDYLCTSLESFLYQSAFISSFIIANNNKIQKISDALTKTDSLQFNNISCNYGKIWGGVTILKKYSANSNIYHVIDDTLPSFDEAIKQDKKLKKLAVTDDFYLVKTEDYNLCKKRIYNAIEHTDILFKREIHTTNKKYFSGVSFGLEGSVNSHIVNINEHRDFKHITEKLITAATMAMVDLDDVVNPAIDAHGIDEIPSPEVYIVSVCLVDHNNKELNLMERYNNSLLAFNDKENIFDTAVSSANGKNSTLMPYGVSMDLYIKVINFNFIFKKDNLNNNMEDYSAKKNINHMAMEKMLGIYKDDSFSSVKIFKDFIEGNLNLSIINDHSSLLIKFCNNIITKHIKIDNDNTLHSVNIKELKLDDNLLLNLSKIEYLIDSLLIMYSDSNYNTYAFAATILLISSLIGGAQLFCCENGLSKIDVLDNHIKYLTTEVFVNNNTNIDFNGCFTENIVYKQIEQATQNQAEEYLLY